MVVDHHLETVCISIQHDDGHGNACFAQRHPFVGKGNGQKANPLMLQHAGHFVGTGTVSGGFVHNHDADVGP